MVKRKRLSEAQALQSTQTPVPIPPLRQPRRSTQRAISTVTSDPVLGNDVFDGVEALRASPSALPDDPMFGLPDSSVGAQKKKSKAVGLRRVEAPSNIELEVPEPSENAVHPSSVSSSKDQVIDPEGDEIPVEDVDAVMAAASRPPPVDSDYLPLPWKGRLGYACLCTYLRFSNPPVFSSRTCRIASIVEHRHPLKDPTQPHHATKNRPDLDQAPDVARGQRHVESLGLANAKDIVKMLRWNDKYGIKFLRLSSEMFPFASHEEYGYKLAPFASEVLADAGRVAAELGHRLTTHPGQFTQLGSPRAEVIRAAIRDLEYHAELLSLLKLPAQQDRDAVMILHMGGVYGDKAATLDRFRENYKGLSKEIKKRIVLENDDVSYTVHDLLPICEELNIPLVLDYHHHNILFDADKVREGTKDIMQLYDRIRMTWTRKGITQKMHYSEPTAAAITPRQRRKHSPRVATLPPCPPDTDLMIEAKDKEQAVFELMRTFKLPGWESFSNLIPYTRQDENKPERKAKATPKKSKKEVDEVPEIEKMGAQSIPANEFGMGGPQGRVYWPPGMEEWLRPVKRIVKKKDDQPAKLKKAAIKTKEAEDNLSTPKPQKGGKAIPKKATTSAKKKSGKRILTPSTSDESMSEPIPDLSENDMPPSKKKTVGKKTVGTTSRPKKFA